MDIMKLIFLMAVIFSSGCATSTVAEKIHQKRNKLEKITRSAPKDGRYFSKGSNSWNDKYFIVGNYCGIKEESNTKYHTFQFPEVYGNLTADYLEIWFSESRDSKVVLRTVDKSVHGGCKEFCVNE
ncbi:MAG: hypothetical protein HGA20_16110 [Geobacteraceae bacterium]|nr:hypothetical protein [Geobacteraceae bacterium]